MPKQKKIDIHDYDKQLKNVLKRVKANKNISASNRKTILKFYDNLLAENLSKPRLIYYLGNLSKIAVWLKKDFNKAAKKDIENVMRKINQMDYTEWTKRDYRVTLKKFYKWLKGCDEGIYPPEVNWIKTHVSIDKQELPNNLPDEEDAKKMIEAAEHPRDKALIACLYESGCRIGEIASLKISDINFDEYGAHMVVNGKTGSRRIRLIFSAPILGSWINVHPDKDKSDAPLWIVLGTTKNFSKNRKNKDKYHYNWSYELKYPAITKMLKKTAKKAGITKKINPHAWRHARATFLANKLTEQQLKHLFGWTQASEMAATYVHLSGRDVDDALLAVYGKKKFAENKQSQLTPLNCPRCKENNEYNNVFCKKCGWTLDKDTAVKLDEKRKDADQIINALTKNPASLKLIAQTLSKLGLVDKLMKI